MADARREDQFHRALSEHVHLGAGRHGPMVRRDDVPKRDGSLVAVTRCACGKSFIGHAWKSTVIGISRPTLHRAEEDARCLDAHKSHAARARPQAYHRWRRRR